MAAQSHLALTLKLAVSLAYRQNLTIAPLLWVLIASTWNADRLANEKTSAGFYSGG